VLWSEPPAAAGRTLEATELASNGWTLLFMHSLVVIATGISFFGARAGSSTTAELVGVAIGFTFAVGVAAREISRTGKLPRALFAIDGLGFAVWLVAAVASGAGEGPVALILMSNMALVGVALHASVVRIAGALGGIASATTILAGVITGGGDLILHGLAHLLCMVTLVTVVSVWGSALRAAGERTSRIIKGLDAVVWEELVDTEGAMEVSHQAERMFGWPVECWRDPHWWMTLIHPDDREMVVSGLGVTADVTMRLRTVSGDYLWVENRVRGVADQKGRHTHFRGVILDRTTEFDAVRRSRRLSNIVEVSDTAHWIFQLEDGETSLSAQNPAATDLLAFDPSGDPDRVGNEVFGLLAACSPSLDLDELLEACLSDGETIRLEEVEGPLGRNFDVRLARLDDASVDLALVDVTERVDSRRRLSVQALHDDLTGLPNRAQLKQYTTDRLANGDHDLAVLLLDLDQFKEVNDSLGHPVGDRLLVQASRRLLNTVGEDDLVVRLGGDEFAVVTGGSELASVKAAASRIVDAIERLFVIDGLAVQSGVSVGIATTTAEEGDDLEALLRKADVAMYEAKRRGSGWTVYDPAVDHHTVERIGLHAELATAIAGGQMEFWFQPLVDVRTGNPVGGEALARWRHPVHGVLTPDRFLELVLVSGQMNRLTRAAISQTFEFGHELAARGHDLRLSVNMSARDLHDETLLDWVDAQLDMWGMPAGGVCLEVTEGELMEDATTANRTLAALVDRGFCTAIDDFGTGFSSMSQLGILPVSDLKLDQSFVSDLGFDEADEILVRSMIDLGHNLGMRVVAEGVETDESLALLTAFGCDMAQGYRFGRPMTRDDFVHALESSGSSGAVTTEVHSRSGVNPGH